MNRLFREAHLVDRAVCRSVGGVRGNSSAARRDARTRFIEPLLSHLQTAGLGHMSEIADAEAPFAPKGCPFQAWSLGELLRLDRIVLAETKYHVS